MRKFYLRNDIGEQKPLNGENGIWLSNPTGLGLAYSKKYADLGEGLFHSKTQNTANQGSIVGEFVFTGDSYGNYKTFMDWLAIQTRLILVYQPKNEAFYRRVELSNFAKGELGDGKWLKCSATFQSLTPWYSPDAAKIEMTSQTATAMRYPYTYNSSLHYGISSAGEYAYEITPKGHIDAAIRLTYTGAITNPDIKLISDSGSTLGEIKITGTFVTGDVLEVCTVPGDTYIRKKSGSTITDLITSGAVDITKNPLIRVPATEPSTVKLSSDSTTTGTAVIEVDYYYRSV